jgi:hypothetical protein
MFNSLRHQLLAVWILLSIAGLSVALLMFAIYRQHPVIRREKLGDFACLCAYTRGDDQRRLDLLIRPGQVCAAPRT